MKRLTSSRFRPWSPNENAAPSLRASVALTHSTPFIVQLRVPLYNLRSNRSHADCKSCCACTDHSSVCSRIIVRLDSGARSKNSNNAAPSAKALVDKTCRPCPRFYRGLRFPSSYLTSTKFLSSAGKVHDAPFSRRRYSFPRRECPSRPYDCSRLNVRAPLYRGVNGRWRNRSVRL